MATSTNILPKLNSSSHFIFQLIPVVTCNFIKNLICFSDQGNSHVLTVQLPNTQFWKTTDVKQGGLYTQTHNT